MPIRVPHSLRRVIASRLLDFAETLPQFNGGPIHVLQMVRGLQRRDADSTYERTRPPEGWVVDQPMYRLIEIFQQEELGRLLSGLRQLFPNPSEEFLKTISELERSSRRISATRWLTVGVVERSEHAYMSGVRRQLKALPKEVGIIKVHLHQILPSIWVVALDVTLTDDAQQQRQQLQNRRYLGEVEFTNVLPVGKYAYGHSSNMAQAEMRQAHDAWSTHLLVCVEACLAPYLSGHFMRQGSTKRPRLPAIEVFVIRGTPSDGPAILADWGARAPLWLEAIGVDFKHWNSFADSNMIFTPSEFSDGAFSRHQVVVLYEALKKASGKEDDFSTPGLLYHLEFFTNELTQLLAIIELLFSVERVIEELRHRVFTTTRPNWISALLLSPYIRLNDASLQLSMLLERIRLEFDDHRSVITRGIWIDVHLEAIMPDAGGTRKGIKIALIETIEFRLSLLKRHMELASTWLNQYLALRNTGSMYWLSLFVGIATIVGLFGIDRIVDNIQGLVGITLTLLRVWLSE